MPKDNAYLLAEQKIQQALQSGATENPLLVSPKYATENSMRMYRTHCVFGGDVSAVGGTEGARS